MLVTVPDAVAVSATNRFGETWVVADEGDTVGPEGLNPRGGIDLEADDLNPERGPDPDQQRSGAPMSATAWVTSPVS